MGGLESKKGVAYFEYDFAKHGGAVGDITVYGDGIPKGAVINNGIIHAKAAITSGTAATIAIKAIGSEDVLAAYTGASLTLNALKAVVPVGTAATSFRVTSSINSLTFTVASVALTAGKAVVALDYWVTDQD